jgi:ribosomal protein L10
MKGDHEKTVDMVRQLIRQGKGMTEIMNFTNLSAEEFTQIRNKLQDKRDKETIKNIFTLKISQTKNS